MAEWACSRCTYLNPPSHNPRCAVCEADHRGFAVRERPLSMSGWACSRCTYLNPPSHNPRCAVCEADRRGVAAPQRRSPYSNFIDLEPDEISASSLGPVFLPLQRCSSAKRSPLPERFSIDVEAEEGGAEALGAKRTRKEDEEEVVVDIDDIGKGMSADDSPLPNSSGWRRREKVVNNHKNLELRVVGKRMGGDDSPLNSSGWRRIEKLANNHKDMELEVVESIDLNPVQYEVKILSYNVWFREDLEVQMRMDAIGDIIKQYSPDLICFQEVTPNIYEIFQKSYWWKSYKCSLTQEMAATKGYFCMQLSRLPVREFTCNLFSNTAMGRELCLANIEIRQGKNLMLATSHLESPCPGPPKWDQMFSKERVAQAKESINHIKHFRNVVFCGDMNWDDKLDGAFPLPEGWIDAWMALRPNDNGWTYDTKANQMLAGNRSLQKRLDRFLCSLQDLRVESIQMVGREAIPGLTHFKEKKGKGGYHKLELPVLPSDHFGLLLTLRGL